MKRTLTLLALSMLCIVPTNLYLPIMPGIQQHFALSQSMIQASIAIHLAAESISPLFIGPLLERFGRKPTMIALCLLFIASATLCLLAHSPYLFLLGRALQGATLSGIKTGKRTLYRDYFSGRALAKLVGYTLPLVSITLAASPILGGYGQSLYGWQSFFYLCILVYAGVLLLVLLALPQTPKQCTSTPTHSKQAYLTLIKSPHFMLWTTASGLSLGFTIAYHTSSPLIYQNFLGLSPIYHGWISGLTIVSMSIGSLITHRCYQTWRPRTLTTWASGLLIASALSAIAGSLWGPQSPWTLLLPYLFGLIGITITFACAFSTAMTPWGHITPFASALYNTHKHLIATLASLALTLTHETSMLPLAITWLIVSSLQMACLQALKKYS